MRGLRGRRKAPALAIRWGEKGLKGIRYIGPMPRDFRGCYTKKFYVYNDRRPLLGIDVRDLPGLAEDAGPENLEVRQDDGAFVPVTSILQTEPPVKAKAVSKSKKPTPKPSAEKEDEVSDVD